MANTLQHEDFGEKIGGAKKDLWQSRGLYVDDLTSMNSREADKYVKKDNVWKKPDYQALINDGLPVGVAYFIKKVRDSLPAAPHYTPADDTPEKKLARQKQYVDTVRQVQGVTEQVKTRTDAIAAFEKCMIDAGYYERVSPGISGYYASPTQKGRENPAVTDKLAKTLFVRSEIRFDQDYTRAAERVQFGVAKEYKPPRGYEVLYHDGQNSWSKDNSWKPATWYVTRGRQIIKTNFDTKTAALEWARDLAKQRGDDGKQRYVPEQLQHVRRDGPDYRHGMDATGQHYLDAFGFKGGEFGNWMSQDDRQASLNMGFDALRDLADALKISDKDISYGGALSIAFGARGSGNAVAHYEPMRQVINLTKMRGAGSLAHEWWHGLDDFMGQKLCAGGLLSEKAHKHPLMQKLVDTMRYRPETMEEAIQRTWSSAARHRKNAESWLPSGLWQAIHRTGDGRALAHYDTLKSAFLSGEIGSVEKINTLHKEATGRVIPKAVREKLEIFERILHGEAQQDEPVPGRVASEYLTASRKIAQVYEKDGGYWDSNVEMTARAFATYVMDKLPTRSDYLVGHAENAIALVPTRDGSDMELVRAYPMGAERKAINAVFDELVEELKREGILTHDDRPQPKQPDPEVTSGSHEAGTDFHQDAPAEQLSLFGGPAKPSLLGRLEASKAEVRKVEDTERPVKKHDPEL